MPPADPPPCPERPIDILHLEADPDDAIRLLEQLEDVALPNARITTVERLADGLQRLRATRFQIALLDLDLADAQGFSTFERLRLAAPDLPVVVLAEEPSHDLAVRLLRRGAQEVLDKKHVSADVLRIAVRHAIERHQYTLELDLRARRLEEAETRVRRLIEANADAVIIVDAEGLVRFVNPAAEKLFGRPSPELLSHPFGFPLVDGQTTELDILRADGSTSVAEMRVVEIGWGDQPAYLASLRDATERKRLEARLLRAQRMESIGALAGGIAHDLNNILTPIMMAVEMLQSRVKDLESQGLLQTLAESSQRGAEMVRQVLTFARGIEGTRSLLHPKELIADVARILNDTFLKQVKVTTAVAPDVWSVTGDRTQLHQVFLNLGVNARDAMADGGDLTIEARNLFVTETQASLDPDAKAGPYVVFSVTDTGTGIPTHLLPKIFDPFFTTKEVGKGTGLGLATVQGIVKGHAGFVTVYSEVGRGSTFKVYLPAKPTEGVGAASARVARFPRGNAQLVLIVDDEAPIREITQSTLETFGYRTLVARDGPEALALYAQHHSDIALVLTDMMMPLMDGSATTRALRAINPKVKIIATSGLGTESQAQSAYRAGCDEFLPKPYSTEVLLETLHRVLLTPGTRHAS